MTPDEADHLLQLVNAIASAIYTRWEEWTEEQLDLPLPAALEVAVPPHPIEQAHDDDEAHGSRDPSDGPARRHEPALQQNRRPY